MEGERECGGEKGREEGRCGVREQWREGATCTYPERRFLYHLSWNISKETGER